MLTSTQNRGIGRAICQLILSKSESSELKLVATSRKGEDLGLGPEVWYPSLDISKRESIKALAKDVSAYGQVDVLINNAGVNLDAKYGPETAKTTLDVNYRGTQDVCVHALSSTIARRQFTLPASMRCF